MFPCRFKAMVQLQSRSPLSLVLQGMDKKHDEKNALYIHFTMKDNPSLTKAVRERYERLYSGVFYERFILGKWTAASGVVYPMFKESKHVFDSPPECDRFIISLRLRYC